ncbi:MAG: hypothetical protein ACNYNX_04335 [Leucobacter sp.]
MLTVSGRREPIVAGRRSQILPEDFVGELASLGGDELTDLLLRLLGQSGLRAAVTKSQRPGAQKPRRTRETRGIPHRFGRTDEIGWPIHIDHRLNVD